MKSPFLHFLQGTDFAGLNLACEEDFTVAALTDLCNNVELVNLELSAPTAKDNSLATTIRLELRGIFGIT